MGLKIQQKRRLAPPTPQLHQMRGAFTVPPPRHDELDPGRMAKLRRTAFYLNRVIWSRKPRAKVFTPRKPGGYV